MVTTTRPPRARKLSAKAIRDAELKAYVIQQLEAAWAALTADHHRDNGSGAWYDIGVATANVNFALTALETGDRHAYNEDRPYVHPLKHTRSLMERMQAGELGATARPHGSV